jgi:P-type Ca2+ transporter type 2C
MAVQADTSGQPATAGQRWYARSPDEVAAALGADPASGLSSARAAELLGANGPNALPEEKPKPGWRRFLDEYRSYMQLILVGAAVVSLVIREWGTAVLLLVLTLLNAVVGLRQEGKAESAMNALKSMMKATARVRRDGIEAEIRPSSWWSAMSCSSPPGIRCRRTVASSRPAPCRSTSRP